MARPYRKKNSASNGISNKDDGMVTAAAKGKFGLAGLVLAGLGIVWVMVAFSGTLRSCLLVESSVTTKMKAPQEEVPRMWDSTNATVIGFATGYHLSTYKLFVGSLRNVGFKGNIILALSPDVHDDIVKYLTSRDVIMHKVQYTNCTHGKTLPWRIGQSAQPDPDVKQCVSPYGYLKARWGRFPLLRDYLEACTTCTGPVLFSDVRDVFFQMDPFGSGDPYPTGLQVFEEHKKQTTTSHWLVDEVIKQCKGRNDPLVGRNLPHLCSGTTIGTRQAMLDYMDIMHEEMKVWMAKSKCRLRISADDQSIHNYLFYNDKLPFATSIPNRQGIVHTIGYQAAQMWVLFAEYRNTFKDLMESDPDTFWKLSPMKLVKSKEDPEWIKSQFELTDKEGFATNFDGTRSRVVHHYDRFGQYCGNWFAQVSGLPDK